MNPLSEFLIGKGSCIDIPFEFPLYDYDKAVKRFGHHQLLKFSGMDLTFEPEEEEMGRPMFLVDTMTFPKGITREELHGILGKHNRYGKDITFMCVDGFESDIIGILFDIQLEFTPRLVYGVDSMVRTLDGRGMNEEE